MPDMIILIIVLALIVGATFRYRGKDKAIGVAIVCGIILFVALIIGAKGLLVLLWWIAVITAVLLSSRFIFELVGLFFKNFKPVGVVLLIKEITYSATNPPLKFIRRMVPSISIGKRWKLDLAFLVLTFICSLTLVAIGQILGGSFQISA